LKASCGIVLMQNGRARFYDAARFDICASVPFDCLDVAGCRARTLRAFRSERLVAVATRKTRTRVGGHVRPNVELTGRQRRGSPAARRMIDKLSLAAGLPCRWRSGSAPG
jgi:hypothetical protein